MSGTVVYVTRNDPRPDGNAVLAFRRRPGGTLQPHETIPTRGRGVVNPGSQFDTEDFDQVVQVDAGRRLLFAANGGSDSIAVLSIDAQGRLAHVDGSPFASGGVQPVSVGINGRYAFVVNKDRDPDRPMAGSQRNYVSFRLTDTGQLAAVSTVAVPAGSSPSQALVAREGRLVFGADLRAGVLQSFRVGDHGRLDQLSPTPVESSLPSPLGLAVHPIRPILYAGLPAARRVGVYTFDDAGRLSAVTTVPNSGIATCWLAVNAGGTTLFTSNNADNSVSVYDLTDPLAPVEVQHLPLAGGSAAYQLCLDPAGDRLYVVSTNAASGRREDNVLHQLAVATDGRLSDPTGPIALEVANGAQPAGVAVLRVST